MRLNKRSLWSFLIVMFALLVAVPAFARPRSSSRSSRPRSTSRSTSKPSPSRSPKASPKRGSKTGKASKKGFGSSKKKAGKSKKATKTDQKAYDKAKANGRAFKDRKSAAADFKTKNAAKYTSTYASQPTSRPGHIPQTTMVGGNKTVIIYDRSHGGYGHMGAAGWIGYNAMADVAMASYYNRQMASAGWAYGPRPVVGIGGGMIFLYVLGGIVALVVVGAIVRGGGS